MLQVQQRQGQKEFLSDMRLYVQVSQQQKEGLLQIVLNKRIVFDGSYQQQFLLSEVRQGLKRQLYRQQRYLLMQVVSLAQLEQDVFYLLVAQVQLLNRLPVRERQVVLLRKR